MLSYQHFSVFESAIWEAHYAAQKNAMEGKG